MKNLFIISALIFIVQTAFPSTPKKVELFKCTNNESISECSDRRAMRIY